MSFDVLLPVNKAVFAQIQLQHPQSLGHFLKIHTEQEGIPPLEKGGLAVLCIRENRRDRNYLSQELNFDEIRNSFYELFPGNWTYPIVDLGDIEKGATVEDTYYAVKQIIESLLKQQIIPIVIGGSQDLVYPMYRAYDHMDQMVNVVNVDSKFDIGNSDQPLDHRSYIGKIIIDKPYNLFNYSNVGYQTFFNPQEEIDLIERLHFDAYRLGNVTADMGSIEPVLRDADLVSIDINAIKSSELSYKHNKMPNGFDGKQICSLARYAGISDKVSSFGIFEFKNDSQEQTAAMLVAQMIWYFIEGVNYRANEILDLENERFITYSVPIDDEVLVFYKSSMTERWWIEIPFISGIDNKLKRHTLLPCTYQDYEDACNQNIPDRWFKARYKNEI